MNPGVLWGDVSVPNPLASYPLLVVAKMPNRAVVTVSVWLGFWQTGIAEHSPFANSVVRSPQPLGEGRSMVKYVKLTWTISQ